MTRLEQFLQDGLIRLVGGEYIGIAWDNTEVWLGRKGEEKNLDDYLESHPWPKDW